MLSLRRSARAQALSGRWVPLTVREWPRNSAMGSPFLIDDPDVVDPRTPAPRHLGGIGGQPVAFVGRGEIGHGAVLRDGALIVGIAGEGEGRVGQDEDVAAMARAVAVGHVVPDPHDERRSTRCYAFEGHAQSPGRVVVVPHRSGAGLGKRLRGQVAGRRHGPTEAAARCRSRFRSSRMIIPSDVVMASPVSRRPPGERREKILHKPTSRSMLNHGMRGAETSGAFAAFPGFEA